MASQGPHLQEVMSPTPGPEAGVMNGIVRAGNPSPSQPAEPVRGENLQTTDATSGPSISTAGQSPSPQLPQEVRTGGDGTSGLDGSLGTTGACFTVSTGMLADVGGMQGSATGMAQGYGATTAQSGIVVSGVTAMPDGPGQILSAADTGGGTGSMAFETPRSMLPGVSELLGAGAQTSAGQSFFPGFGWLGRVQDLFQGRRTVQQIPAMMFPSPLQQSPTSPPRWELQNSSPPGAGRAVQEEGSPAPLFSDADLQRMAAMEQRAPLLFGSPPQQPGPHTESSSIPHDAIQAEVARQLAGMRQELENQMRRASRQAEAELARLQSRVIEGAIAPPPPPPGGSGLLGMESTGLRGDSGIGSGLPKASSPVPLIPQAPSGPNPAIGFVQPKAPPPPADTQVLASLLSGSWVADLGRKGVEDSGQEQALQ